MHFDLFLYDCVEVEKCPLGVKCQQRIMLSFTKKVDKFLLFSEKSITFAQVVLL